MVRTTMASPAATSSCSGLIMTSLLCFAGGVTFCLVALEYTWKKRNKSTSSSTLDEIGRRYLTTTNKIRPNDINRYVGGDKVSKKFTCVYEEILSPYRNNKSKFNNKNLQFLEIGIWYGKSLAMFADWFGRSSDADVTIYGVDIHLDRFYEHKPELERLGAFQPNTSANVEVYEFDTSSKQFETWIRQQQRPMDIVLDDGNHTVKSQWQLFELIFPLLAPGGIYIIEDIEEPMECFFHQQHHSSQEGKDIMSGFPAILATLADPGYPHSKKTKNRYMEKLKEETQQSFLKAKVDVEKLRSRIDRLAVQVPAAKSGDDDNDDGYVQQRERLKKALQQKEAALSSMMMASIYDGSDINNNNNKDDEQRQQQQKQFLFEEKGRILDFLVKDLLRVEVREQNVIFYKKPAM